MSRPKRHRALIVGQRDLDRDLRLVLNGYGYVVEHCDTRLQGFRLFRAGRHPLVILDVEILAGLPERTFRFFRMIRENTIVLVACERESDTLAARCLMWGAHDVLRLPLRREALNMILTRTSTFHRELVRDTFRRQFLYFTLSMLPLWGILAWLALR